MKVRFTLFDMDAFLKELASADLHCWRLQVLYELKKKIKNFEKDGFWNKMVSASPQIAGMRDMALMDSKRLIENLDDIISFSVESTPKKEDTVVIEIVVAPDFFYSPELIRSQFMSMFGRQLGKRLAKATRVMGRQEIIDSWKNGIRKDYTHSFNGEILEDDGEELKI